MCGIIQDLLYLCCYGQVVTHSTFINHNTCAEEGDATATWEVSAISYNAVYCARKASQNGAVAAVAPDLLKRLLAVPFPPEREAKMSGCKN